MIIWSGFGILVIVSIIAGAVAGAVVGGASGVAAGGSAAALLGPLAGGFVATGVNWMFARMLDKPGRTVIDEQTGQRIQLKRNHSLFFIPIRFWTPIIALGSVLLLAVVSMAQSSQKQMAQKYPGKAAFDQADGLLISKRKGGVANGNTADARAAAEGFSEALKSMASLSFSGGSKKNLLTDGEFLTYCRKNKKEVIFLCHVPSLRSYKTDDAKSALSELAWLAGQHAATKIGSLPPDTRLIVALRGIGSYSTILDAPLKEDTPAPQDTVTKLYELFNDALAGTDAPPVQGTALVVDDDDDEEADPENIKATDSKAETSPSTTPVSPKPPANSDR